MSYVAMSRAPLEKATNAWEYKETLSVAGNGVSVLLPPDLDDVTVTLEVSAGSGKVQATTSTVADVKSDVAVWVDWTAGTVTQTTQDYCKPPTALRMVNVSGVTTLHLRAQ